MPSQHLIRVISGKGENAGADKINDAVQVGGINNAAEMIDEFPVPGVAVRIVAGLCFAPASSGIAKHGQGKDNRAAESANQDKR